MKSVFCITLAGMLDGFTAVNVYNYTHSADMGTAVFTAGAMFVLLTAWLVNTINETRR